MSEPNGPTRAECEETLRHWGNVEAKHYAAECIRLLDERESLRKQAVAKSEEWWDQNSVQCGCCSVQLVTRGGSFTHNGLLRPNIGLSHEEGEEEALCGLCAGDELHRIAAERDELRSENDSLRKDKTRLDWLESEKGGVAHEDPANEFDMQYPWEAYSGLKLATAIRVWKSNIREAIDAAREYK